MAGRSDGRVLVTRPEPGATRTAQRLRAAGWEPVVVPLSEVVPLSPRLSEGAYDAIVVSSANAVRHMPAGMARHLAATPLFAVGDETATAASKAGFGDVRSSAGSSADLARDVTGTSKPGTRIGYLCGRVRLDGLEADLAAAGVRVTAIETYDTLPRAPSADELAALDRAPIAAALVYSARAAEALAVLARPRLGTMLSATAFIAISQRVAERLSSVAAGRVLTAAASDEDSMFDLLPGIGHEPAPIAGKFG